MFDWHRFVWAWERVLGDERRPASAIPNDELLTIRGAYKFWRDDNRSRRISAEEWLRERAEVFERQGYYKHPEAGQMKITSGFHYEVFGFDSDGNLSADGPFFSAARTFSYESGAYGMTHADYCEHVHPSPHDAQPCLQRLKRKGGRPSHDLIATTRGEEPAVDPGSWVSGWMTQLRQVGLRGGEERAPAILVTGQPQEFRELVARSLGVPVDNVVHVYSCPATEEFMMQAGSTVDVIIVSPEVRLGDVMPMVEFLHSSYPGTPIVLLHDPRKSEVAPPSHPGIVAVVDIGEGPEGLRQAVLGTVSSA